jgi:hypothetical protein
MTASLCLHGALFELSAYPENSGSISIDVRDRFNGAINSVTIFTGSPEAAREIYEALGPIFQRHGGKAGPVHVRPAHPQEPPQEPEPTIDEGWIEWGGGDCPVSGDALVDWKMRGGDNPYWMPTKATHLRWSHGPSEDDIVAYRVVREEG